MASDESPARHADIAPVEWLLGKWKSTSAMVFYPTMTTVHYNEDVEFSHRGQPVLIYSSQTNHAENGKPLHSERGFLHIKHETNHVALTVAHTFGLVEVAEGEVNGKKISLESTDLGRMSFTAGSVVTKIQRSLELVDENTLKGVIHMGTVNQPLQEHLHVTYKRL